ncbi:MAG: hypothetical protein AAF416_16810 [Pseudomonadota bacterium]
MIEAIGGRSHEYTLELYDRFREMHRAGPASASPDEVAAFQSEMGQVDGPDVVTDDVQVAQAGQVDSWVVQPQPQPGVEAAEASRAIGDRILDSFTEARDAWRRMEGVTELFAEGMDPARMLMAQYQMSIASVSVTTLSNSVHGLTQKLDGLLKTG